LRSALTLHNITILSGDPLLAEAALKAMRPWRCKATLVAGPPVDVLMAWFHGIANPLYFRGELLGIPLTLAVCPDFTMICVAGLVRAPYLNRK
jgi:hypothetical protein